MAPVDIRRQHEALDWLRRINDPDFADWDGHVAWLEAAPENGVAFDMIALSFEAKTDGLAAAAGPPPRETESPSANDNAPSAMPRERRRLWPVAGGALAAGIVAAVSLPSLFGGGAQSSILRTAAGETRSVRLPDGTQVAMNGATEIRLDPASPRVATLVSGEALFSVVHDADHPFAVRAGDATFQDVGTVFDVVKTRDHAAIAVREGAVLYDPAGAKLRLDAGRMLRLAGGEAVVSPVARTSVGGWRSGRLTYAGAPIGEVAEDLSRATGRPFTVDAAASGRRFAGVIVLDKDRAVLARRVSAVTGFALTPQGDGWRMALPPR